MLRLPLHMLCHQITAEFYTLQVWQPVVVHDPHPSITDAFLLLVT